MDFYTITGDANAEYIEKKSQFIGYVSHCETEDDASRFIESIRSAHRKATHNVYAYILKNTSKYSDDGEPQGTAGVPVLETLKKHNLTEVCCVITRYFGGILLGGGGLVRAYSHTAKLALENAKTAFMRESNVFSVTVDYTLYDKVMYFLRNQSSEFKVLNEEFVECVNFSLVTPVGSNLTDKITELTNAKATVNKLQTTYFNYG